MPRLFRSVLSINEGVVHVLVREGTCWITSLVNVLLDLRKQFPDEFQRMCEKNKIYLFFREEQDEKSSLHRR